MTSEVMTTKKETVRTTQSTIWSQAIAVLHKSIYLYKVWYTCHLYWSICYLSSQPDQERIRGQLAVCAGSQCFDTDGWMAERYQAWKTLLQIRHDTLYLHAPKRWQIASLICSTESNKTRRPVSADRTARRQFQATGQPVSQMQASDAMTSWLPRYEAQCVQRRCFQCGLFRYQGTELPHAYILIALKRQLIALQLLYNETLQKAFRPLLSKLSKTRQI